MRSTSVFSSRGSCSGIRSSGRFPSRPRWSPWLLVPYLILADVQNTLLAAWLTFSDAPLYPYYVTRPRLGNLSAIEDQAAAGVLMWVPGSLAYLLPLFVIGVRLLFGDARRLHGRVSSKPEHARRRSALPARRALPIIGQPAHRPGAAPFDLLRVPILGRFLKWRHARVCLQLPLLLLAIVIVFDGIFGPPVAGMNLAGILPWIHWRGLLVLGLLVCGNVFCMACPFTLPRAIARRFRTATLSWPPWLRNKWPAIVLLVVFLWAYETFALWDSPFLTAAIVVAYFVAAFLIDALFRGASFCKYVCPIGQFNFVQSLVSPLEVKVREPDVCSSCRTKECIRGTERNPRLRAWPLSAAEVEQHGLHVLPGLRSCLPARERRYHRGRARLRRYGLIRADLESAGSAGGSIWPRSLSSSSAVHSPMRH